MGRPKLLLPVEGVPMLRRVVDAALASRCLETVVVLGADEAVYRSLLDGLPVRVVHNPEYAHGLATSLRAGVAALSPESRAVVVLLADQPWIGPDVIDTLIETYREGGHRIVASAYAGTVGVPALFDAALFLELLTLEGDAGARTMIERYARHGVAVPLPEARARDVDVPEDLPESPPG